MLILFTPHNKIEYQFIIQNYVLYFELIPADLLLIKKLFYLIGLKKLILLTPK